MSDYARDVLVSTQWVEDQLGDDSIRVVEVDENPALYGEAHIPGAIGLDWRRDLQDQVRRDFLGPAEFGELFGGRGVFEAREGDQAIRADRDEVRAALEGDVRLVDVRSPQEYSGELIAMAGYEQEGAQRAGHIPGAASVPWAQAVREDGTFKSADELRELYTQKGVIDGAPVIAYCRIGERSAHTWFVLHELLGHDQVKNYDGSWTEWGNMVNVPIEKDV